ncbi:MAG: TatD family hydrolase [Eubacteriales bacterium]
MIIDSHAHYDDDAFTEDREELLRGLPEAGIEAVVNIGANIERSRESIALSEQYAHVYATVGVHPDDIGELSLEKIEELRELAKHKKVVAIGEFGLDYSREEHDKEIQKKWFQAQLELALECNLPIVIHSRDAAKDTLEMLKGPYGKGQRGIIHCYSYSVEVAREFLKLGYSFGIGGVATFKNAKKLKEAIAEIPLERIVLETDCPYLAPTPYRGKRNDSTYLPLIAEEIATIKEIDVEMVIQVTTKNARTIYQLNE